MDVDGPGTFTDSLTSMTFAEQLGLSDPSDEPVSSSDQLSPPADGDGFPAPRMRRRPIPRKGHTKSRGGCYNCKRRKVKCQENRPECDHCKRIGLDCEYPPPRNSPVHCPPTPTLATYSLQSTPTFFSIDDMRFFQHFLVKAYPPLPLRGEQIWKTVSGMAHSVSKLLSARGLPAWSRARCAITEYYRLLTLCTDMDYSKQALSHRIAAIKSLNAFLSQENRSKDDGDAAFGAVMALTFQSSYMPDGMIDFLAMVRGCHIVASKAMPSFEDSAFSSFSREEHVSACKELAACTATVPSDYKSLSDAFCTSLQSLAPICKSTIELTLMADIKHVVRLANRDPYQAYYEMSGVYNRFGYMTNEDFNTFTDPQSYAAQILLVHFFLVDYVLGMTAFEQLQMPSFDMRKAISLDWMEKVLGNLPDEYKTHADWILTFARTIMPNRKVSGGCRLRSPSDGSLPSVVIPGSNSMIFMT